MSESLVFKRLALFSSDEPINDKEPKFSIIKNKTFIIVCLSIVLLAVLSMFIKSVFSPNLETSTSTNVTLSTQTEPVLAKNEVSFKVYNGWTLQQIDEALVQWKYAKKGEFIKAVASIAKELSLPFSEGFFLSGTYVLTKGKNLCLDLARKMAYSLMSAVQPYYQVIGESELTIKDYVIIASMMSAETKNAQEYPIIASIIHNRLKTNMPLGIDATTRYELNDWTSPLTADIMNTLSPYNTRRQAGLPPTGICCPSVESLYYAINYPQTEYYYYRHDKQGVAHYSVSYDEHLLSQKEHP